MSAVSISARDRRTLLFGGAIIGGLFLSLRGVPSWLAWRTEQRSAAAFAMARATQVASTVSHFSVTLDTLEARTTRLMKVGEAFLDADTLANAESMLSQVIGEAARASMVRIESMETRSLKSERGALPRVTVELRATGDITGLSALIRHLESGPTMIAVRKLRVRPQDPASPDDQPEVLAFGLTLEALVLERHGEKP